MKHSERALLVGLSLKKPTRAGAGAFQNEQHSLMELAELARSAGASVVGSRLQIRDRIDPATLVGRGLLEELKREVNRLEIGLIIVDRGLTPVQLRNLEKGIGCSVIDRTQLILDIFARHAHSREGQLQVELAQLEYLLPRLTGRGTELSRLGGGIGTRGPGEQKLETDRRRIRDRVRRIEQAIDKVRRQRAQRRQARQAVPLGTVALVGYTNAGKSTLFNALTKAASLTSPKMFSTLDPTVRVIRLPSRRRALLSDTVGFIRDLPPGLIAAFRATLEEVQEAALVLQVTDISNPHHPAMDAEVEKVLEDLGVAGRPRLRVFNKVDLLPRAEAEAFLNLRRDGQPATAPGASSKQRKVFVSARNGQGLDELQKLIDAAMSVDPLVRRNLRLPLANGRELAMVFACGRVLHSEVRDDWIHLEAELPQTLAARLQVFADGSGAEQAAF